ncbi:MFS transporter [Pseudooceanicola sp. CBS1P-1]|uniref:MFS transporter n=1 Tax=Pseudooceanicola albus TaxID=2692189 RepID=A0A6L7FX29_9RHOB|nr:MULTISPECIES: MFS transporter [Pseudooceanicola]MBT9383439.1 MFS transporter [Pseudooceanicola endophyticus]MXN16239.1 MFS transporter [Pseudooceanicola albus]
MRTVISFSALILSVILLQLSSGAVSPLDALSGLKLGFTRGEIGLLGSAHFLGFFIGCWGTPRLMGRVGHARAFAALTALGAIAALLHMLVVDPLAWALMRVASGICIAGCYTVIEGWLMAKLSNAERGKVTGVYRLGDMGGSLVAQLLIGVLSPASYVAYNIIAILCCAALLPLVLTRAPAPALGATPRLQPGLALKRSPLAVVAVIVSALSAATFRMMGPVYGQEMGLDTHQISYFLALFLLGGAVAQVPAGWLADRFDRRKVLVGVSLATLASCAASALAPASIPMVLINVFFFGVATYPVYSIASAHAHDFAESHERTELSAALLFYYAVGAMVAPWLSAQLIGWFGPRSIYLMVGAGHVALLLYGLGRMRVRPTPAREARTRFTYAPRTTFIIGRLLRGQRERGNDR